MTHGPDGSILDVGRKTRAVHPTLRRALTHRDGGCRFPCCGLNHCDAHHVEHWADGGMTELGNLLLLCRFHHRELHEGGFRVELEADGEARFYTPAGELIPVAPEPPKSCAKLAAHNGDPVVALTRRNWNEGISIDSETGFPRWNGEILDLEAAIDMLHESLATAPQESSGSCAESSRLHGKGRLLQFEAQ